MGKAPRTVSLILALIVSAVLNGQSVAGRWKTLDDRTGVAKAIVEIRVKDGKLYGTIEDIVLNGKEDARCTECKGELAGAPIKGMQIINGLEQQDRYTWRGGDDSLFDPEQGKSFRSKIWLDPEQPNLLRVRGYWMLFFRTQTWTRVADPTK